MITEITKEMYEYALARIEDLLPLTDDSTPLDDPNMIQLLIYSDVVERYEDVHCQIGLPSIGEVIQDALGNAGMTAEQLAGQSGIDISQINDYISNNTKPTPENGQKICEILDIKPMEIMA